MKILAKAFAIVYVLIFLKGIASGKCVEAHILCTRYSLQEFVFGKGLTQSIIVLLKGLSNAGIGCNPALGMTWLNFPST